MSTTDQHWSYADHNGPELWPKLYKTGKQQSPINIQVSSRGHRCRASKHSKPSKATANSLQVSGARRSHLDSIGEDHVRSSSTSSSGSSSYRNSPQSCSPCAEDFEPSNGHPPATSAGHKCCCDETRNRQNTRLCTTNRKIFLGYPRYLSSVQLCNTGHNWQVNLAKEIANHTLLSGPPLGDREYKLAQLHCHWGEDCDHGSEHQIDGKSFAAELHFVHWNCAQFKSAEEASQHKHGLAVLGVLVQAIDGEQNRNRHLDRLTRWLPDVRESGASTTIHPRLDLKKLFPTNRFSYATYEGSLTTPPLSEVVDWIVFLEPITCSTAQIEQFRQIKCPSGELVKNCRPVQPLNDRVVTIWGHP